MIATKATYLCCYLGAGAIAGSALLLAAMAGVPFVGEAVTANFVYGALFGLLFFIPYLSYHLIFKGMALSLIPSLYQLFFVEIEAIPYILLVNALWGLLTACMIRLCSLEV